MILANWQDQRYLLLPQDVAEQTLQRLRMFVMRADVTFIAADDLQTAFVTTNEKNAAAPWECNALSDDGFAIQLPGNSQIIIGKLDELASEQQASLNHELAMIDASFPEISLATSGQCIPQTVDLDQHEGVSFNKGCYTGQEIVARLHFRGTPSRRLQRFLVNSKSVPQRGDAITDNNGSAQGVIIRAAAVNDGQYKVLASVRLKSLDAELQFESQKVELLN